MKVTLDYQAIGKRLKELREKHNFTQAQLAEYLDVSNGFISQMERGISGITIETAASLSLLYKVPVDFLLLDSGYVLPEIQIEGSIKQKLEKAAPPTLKAVSDMIDVLLVQQEALKSEE